ncbi:MAG: hypothetical protein DCC75_02120 [Proteobacteria bacterium]|nr:MAG: hypothetical protein DCC75_02120 [Pseudomonadota bacterium]
MTLNYLVDLPRPQSQQLIAQAADVLEQTGGDIPKAALVLKAKVSDQSLPAAGQALETAAGRSALRDQYEWAGDGYFTLAGIQQASHPKICRHHAEKFRQCRNVLEIAGGLGFDSAALAKVAKKVTMLESDRLTAEMARRNLTLQRISNVEVRICKAEEFIDDSTLQLFDGLWADPARRSSSGQRVSKPSDYSPDLGWLLNLKISGPCGIKISPGLNLQELPRGFVREWIGFDRECREQILWRGTAVREGTVTLVDENLSYAGKAQTAEPTLIDPCSRDLSGWRLVEPHPALIRSGQLAGFYKEREIELLDPQIAYGVAREPVAPSPWWRLFAIKVAMPFNLKAINEYIKRFDWSSNTEIKKRGFPKEPEEIRKMLSFSKTASSKPGVIVLTRIGDSHWCFLCERDD